MADNESMEVRAARLETTMRHLNQSMAKLETEMRENKREQKEEMDKLRQEISEGFEKLHKDLTSAVSSLGIRLDERVDKIYAHVSQCSQTNGARLTKLEHDKSHTQGMTKGAVAILSLFFTLLGAVIAALVKVYFK